ncbi:hypothetical protein DSM110093_02358 [Sulfitobacter sp. DSM 110093]|uniref:hypothetical protein n=1 Tax=Sulfitobacter sp. DSM 110093 TaxID=2883127 RepID=UPI001FAE6CEE|nr:hypothetical protein [Sulfitobacter sp. DSM 110093]UOA32558.1 hypothetical protein DSM110093_02358 [Sulfitobacter sp. DSM 110093]
MTAHALAKRLRINFGLGINASYRAALVVAHDHGLIDSSGRRSSYELNVIAKAETILCACVAGGGLTKDLNTFLAGARASGVAARLGELLDKPERLAASQFHFDAQGRAIRIFADFEKAVLALEVFAGGPPDGGARILNGAKLVEVLAE